MDETAFDPLTAARNVLRSAPTGSLATRNAEGLPFATFVTVSTDVDGSPLMFLSRLAVHTRNLEADARSSLLLVAPGGEGGDPLAGARLTLEGRAVPVPRRDPAEARMRRRFLARNPAAEMYSAFADFSIYRFVASRGHLVAGFGRIHTIEGTDLVADPALAAAFAEAEDGIVGHMNEDHADAVALYATRLLDLPPAPWRVVAADPDGIDLSDGAKVARLPFPQRQGAVMAVRHVLKALGEKARAG